jgi:phage N-6-adenine-methyltransferase
MGVKVAKEPMTISYHRNTNRSVHFSSKTDLWSTPPELFAALDAEFGFTLDVCAIPENAKCRRFFTREMDGLNQQWVGVCWMNPPCGRQIGKWVQKAYISARRGAMVVCLLPARTDTGWWHEFVTKASEIRFIRGRLRFGGSQNSAPFPSTLVVFRPPTKARQKKPGLTTGSTLFDDYPDP